MTQQERNPKAKANRHGFQRLKALGAGLVRCAVLPVLALRTGARSAVLYHLTSATQRPDGDLASEFDRLLDPVITIDDEGNIRTLNRAATRFFGYEQEEAIGQTISRLIEDPYSKSGDDAISLLRMIAAAKTFRAVGGRSRDGKKLEIEIAVSTSTDETGPAYVVQARDISEHKAIEHAGLEAQRRILDAIESTSEGFALFDREDRLVLTNSKYDELHQGGTALMVPGRRYEEIVRSVAYKGVFQDASERPSAWIGARLRRRASPGHPYEERLKGGRWCKITDHRTAEGGLVQTIIDITEEKSREKALLIEKENADLANRTKSLFLANMSHELRTPLNAIVGFSDMMRNQMVGPIGKRQYLEYSGDVFASAQHLLAIINDILDISRVEAGKVALEEDHVLLQDTVVSSLKLVKARAEEGGVRMVHAITPDLPELMGDERLVKQILVNLLSNAVRFTPQNGRIVLQAYQRSDRGLSLSVADTGIGIAPERMERILNPFEQAENNHTRPFDGTGLGLPLVRHFAKLHGGRFELKSQVGKGTTAIVHFPPDRTIEASDAKAG